ncbi:hypothetical protein QJS66_12925 [Kocuria rhizophila]|nr:hypothetical protein QJS66_12925 [Kocuria rhizophila]
MEIYAQCRPRCAHAGAAPPDEYGMASGRVLPGHGRMALEGDHPHRGVPEAADREPPITCNRYSFRVTSPSTRCSAASRCQLPARAPRPCTRPATTSFTFTTCATTAAAPPTRRVLGLGLGGGRTSSAQECTTRSSAGRR